MCRAISWRCGPGKWYCRPQVWWTSICTRNIDTPQSVSRRKICWYPVWLHCLAFCRLKSEDIVATVSLPATKTDPILVEFHMKSPLTAMTAFLHVPTPKGEGLLKNSRSRSLLLKAGPESRFELANPSRGIPARGQPCRFPGVRAVRLAGKIRL